MADTQKIGPGQKGIISSRGMLYRTKRRVDWLHVLGIKHRKEDIVKWRSVALSAIFTVFLIVFISLQNEELEPDYSVGELHGSSRKLLSASVGNSSKFSLSDCTFEKDHIPGAWIFSHCVCIIIIFIALAIVCDDFFVPSLEIISEKLHLSEDVAGATFMAAGSSAPELFTSVAGVAQETDVGVGTIVGSAVFNLLIIIALTSALAGQVLKLDWRPLARDAFFYAMSIGCFIGFAWDGYFTHYEAAVLLSLYIIYIILMFFNPRIMDWMGTWRCCGNKSEISPAEPDSEAAHQDGSNTDAHMNSSNPKLNSSSQPNAVNHSLSKDGRRLSLTGGHARRISLITRERSHSEIDRERTFHHKRGSIAGVLMASPQPKKSLTPDEAIAEEESSESKEETAEKQKEEEEEEEGEEEEETLQLCPCIPRCPAVRTYPPSSQQAREKGGCLNWVKLILRWILFVPAFPFVCLFSWTIPDCSKERLKKYYVASFGMSVFWIAGLSFAMVTLVERTGCIIGVDTYVMGLVVVAIGTSIPDALSSVLVARDGYGDMAVSNAIGSNVFDINLGLGLPFIIRIAIDKGAPISLLDGHEWVDYFDGTMSVIPHAKFGFILLLILVLALIVFAAARFKLNKWIGVTFVFMYVIFLVYAFSQELYCVRSLEIYC